MTRLEAQGLSVRRGARRTLDGVDLAADAGFVAVVGPNGAGKSTLLATLAGLLTPGAGEVRLDGKPLAGIPIRTLARRRAYLPQNPRVEWPIPVERLVALGLTPVLPAFGGLPAPLAGRVEVALRACDLLGQRDQPATTLSGGELARAMLARALVGDPEVLIADEPLTGLDPRHALDTAERLRALADAGRLVLAALHDLTLAARFATRIVVLKEGRVAFDAEPRAALAPAVLRAVFGVEGRVVETDAGPLVDVARS